LIPLIASSGLLNLPVIRIIELKKKFKQMHR
jgi:hypothetical protein